MDIESEAAFLEFARPLAVKAGDCIMQVYAGKIDVRHKEDRSPVTVADELAEEVILDGLRAQYADIPVVAEESWAAGEVRKFTSDLFILVDPLDGTKEFIRKGKSFTVNIALLRGDTPVLGVVYAPATDTLYSGHVGIGAWRGTGTEADKPGQAIATRAFEPEKLAIVASRSHLNPETEEFLARFPDAALLNIGSSLKFCLVAEGKADLYPRFGPTMEWDTAAGQAVLMAAGGAVVNPDLSPYRYRKPGFRNGFFFAWGDPAVKELIR